jgi:hypothetical protein
VHKQIEETARVEMMLQNNADVLKEENVELRTKIQATIKDKRLAERASSKDKKLAKDRLEKWHAEKHLRRIAENYAAEQEKIAKDMQSIVRDIDGRDAS